MRDNDDNEALLPHQTELDQVNVGTEHHGVPSSETKPTSELSAAPSFTPGPWRFDFVKWTHEAPVIGFAVRPHIESDKLGKRGVPIASCGAAVPDIHANAVYTSEELEANARLIAAAPSLYTALKECVKQMRSAANLLEMFPDDYGDAINSGDWALMLADGQVTSDESGIRDER